VVAGDKETATALRLMGYKPIPFGGNMKVETYEIEEAKAEPQLEAEAVELIEKLGLAGQRSLVKDTSAGETRIPYREMTKGERVVFERVFPKQEKVEEYASGIIPVRVLQVVSHGKELFERVEVWSSEGGSEFLLIGLNGTKWNNQKSFVLARWGVSLLTMDQIQGAAKKLVKADMEKELRECVGKCEVMLKGIEGLVEKRIAGEDVRLPSSY
jgi:hypothetical protein